MRFVQASAGNFLWAKLVANPAQDAVLPEGSPPLTLAGYYSGALRARLPGKPAELDLTKRVLAILRAARAPLLLEDISIACPGHSQRDVAFVVRRLRPLLRTDSRGLSLFHRSLYDYLASKAYCLPEVYSEHDYGHQLLGSPAVQLARQRRGNWRSIRHGMALRTCAIVGLLAMPSLCWRFFCPFLRQMIRWKNTALQLVAI